MSKLGKNEKGAQNMKQSLLVVLLMPMMALAGTLGDGLDNTSLVWTTGGTPSVSGENVNWSYITDDSYSDGDCVTSGAGGAGDATSWLRTTVAGPCKISFRYKYQSYGGTFSLTCDSSYLINRAEYTSSYEGWQYAEFDLESGSHTLTYTYHHPGMGFVNKLNGVRIDEFTVTGQSSVVPPTGGTTWYVNGSTGSDYNSGTSQSSAKATIQAAIDASSAGDTILVAPGTYAPIGTGNKSICIKSLSGAADTIIDGRGIARCVGMQQGVYDSAPILNTNTCIYGFTLQNGYAYYDGGFGGCADNGTYYNCRILNGQAHGGGGCSGSTLYNCLLMGNYAINGGATESCINYNCTITGNSVRDSGVAGWYGTFINCIVYGNASCWSTFFYWNEEEYSVVNCYEGDPGFVDAANGDYRLAAGSPCIDAGDNSYVTGDKDLAGNARIANGTVDIGCYEYGSAPAGGSLTDGLVAYWPFDGNANDASGNGFDYINNGASLATDRIGDVNSAYYFNGRAYLNRDHYGKSIVSNSFSFACWVKPEGFLETSAETIDGMSMLFDEHPLVVNPAGAWGDSSAGMGLAVGHNGVAVIEGSSCYYVPTLLHSGDFGNKWVHLVVTVYDNSAPVLYVNGSYIKTGLQNGRGKAFGAFDVGGIILDDNNWDYHRNYTGAIDDIRIYNRALSAAEVKALYDGTPVTPAPPANGLWTVTKYNLTKSVVPDGNLQEIGSYALQAIGNRSIWNGEPETKTYDKIAFGYDLGYYRDVKFPSDMVDFPGGGSNYFVIDATTSIYVPEAGEWTFACGCDDVFSATISGSGASREFHSSSSGEMSTDLMVVNFPSAGNYNIRLLHVNGWGESGLEFSIARGGYSYFDSSAFKLVGDPASGVTLAGSGKYHTVTFDGNGGDVYPGTRSIAEGAAIGSLPTAWREGYEFLGWHTGKEEWSPQVLASTVVSDNMIVYAVWRLSEYTLWFNANGGSVGTSSVTRHYGDLVGALPVATWDGYNFLGWYDWNGWQVYDSDTVTGDATYYANWERISYAVTFDANGGSGGDVYTYYYGDNLGSLPTPWREGYEFLGWFTAKSGGSQADYWTGVYGNAMYYAQWQIDSYSVWFDANGGSVGTSSVTRNYGSAIGALPTPTRTGYTFLGWYTSASGGSRVYEADVVTSSRTLYAQWQANTYTVTFNANGGDSSCSYSRTYGTQIGSLPAAARSGYAFKGWFTAASGGSQIFASTMVSGDATYYAHWATHAEELAATLGTANVEFATDTKAPWFPEGSAVRSGYISHNGSSTMSVRLYGAGLLSFRWRVSSEPEYDVLSYSVDGIHGGRISGEQGWSSASILVSGDGWHTVRFTYSKDGGSTYGSDCGWVDSLTWTGSAPPVTNFTVMFNANGGTVGTTSITLSKGSQLGELPVPARSGHTFLGWFTAASGGNQVYASTTVVANATYYAHWLSNGSGGGSGGDTPTPPAQTLFTVSFDGNGGSVDTPSVTRTAGTAIGSMPTPEAEGYKFLGWFTTRTGGTQVTDSSTVTQNVTYYAHWKPVDDGNTLWDEDEAFEATAAAIFNGYLMKDGAVVGSVAVKAGKANARSGAAKISAKVTKIGEAKNIAFKGTLNTNAANADFAPGTTVLACAGQPDMTLRLGSTAMWGEFGDCEVYGARDVFAKNPGAAAAAKLAKWQGAYTIALETLDAEGDGAEMAWGYSAITVTVAAKGKTTVKGTMADGSKVSAKTQLLAGDGVCCIPVVAQLYTKKGGIAFNIWLNDDGSISIGEMSVWDATMSKSPFKAWLDESSPIAKAGAALPAEMSFMLSGEPSIPNAEILYDFLPWEVALNAAGRWTLPAAGSIKFSKEDEEYVDVKNSDNPAGLKLTYVSKMGTFKGKFNIYAEVGGKMKKYIANVSGAMVGQRGYGSATIKGLGNWAVLIQ